MHGPVNVKLTYCEGIALLPVYTRNSSQKSDRHCRYMLLTTVII